MTWRPDHATGYYGGGRPTVGAIVGYAYRAWEVTHIAKADPTPEEQQRLDHYTPKGREKMWPYRVSLRRLHGERADRENSRQEIGLRIPIGYSLPTYPNGRVPLCSCHSHPWPCRESEEQAQAAKELAKAEEWLNLLPGCCPACSEVVTSRQKSITFGGPNVLNPLAEGPTYHLRSKCYRSAAAYEEKWVADEPGRKRSLLTLRCEGTVIVHEDGSAECFGAKDSDCPSVYAEHRGYMSCYLQSHGCGKGCTSRRHGTRIAGYPSNPREVTR